MKKRWKMEDGKKTPEKLKPKKETLEIGRICLIVIFFLFHFPSSIFHSFFPHARQPLIEGACSGSRGRRPDCNGQPSGRGYADAAAILGTAPPIVRRYLAAVPAGGFL
jgi:hypothetical protein